MLFWLFACNNGGEIAQIDKNIDPTNDPTSDPTNDPTNDPTAEPTSEPENSPSSEPASNPTSEPTSEPSSSPTSEPTSEPLEPIDDDVFSHSSSMINPINGFIDIPVPITAQATSVMLSVRGKEETVIYEVIDPSGNIVFSSFDWYGISQTLTDAIYTSQTGERSFNWPIRSSDTPLSEGEWTFTFFTNDTSSGSANVDIMVKRDPILSFGTLNVTIAYTTELSYVQDFDAVLDQGIAVWEEIFSAYGITLNIDIVATNISGDIPSPFVGSIDYYSLNAQGDNSDILIMIGENIDGISDQFGVAGSMPGTTARHRIGAVALSWLYAAGPDGVFDSVDIRLLGETLAHEVGHYMGLPHTVEQSWTQFDAISDTPECLSTSACESIFETNIMFPYPICDAESCIEQGTVTSEQQGVWHRYIGVD